MNVVKGEVPLKIRGGREFVLVLDFEALVAAEAAYAKPLAQLTVDAAAGFVGALRAMLFGALLRHQPGTTLADAAAIFQADALAVHAALTAAGEAAYPPADAAEDREPGKAPRAPRGTRSGRSGAKRG